MNNPHPETQNPGHSRNSSNASNHSTPRSNLYHAFLCHRGETKGEYVTGLYGHIRRARMRPFMDSKGFEVGDSIPEKLDEAIRRSAVIIIVLSQNFFASEYCMVELHLAVHLNRTILPVFYDVEPGECEGLAEAASADWSVAEDLKVEWRKAVRTVILIAGKERKEDNELLSEQIVRWLKDHFLKLPLSEIPRTPAPSSNPSSGPSSPLREERYERPLEVPPGPLPKHYSCWGFPLVLGILCVAAIFSVAAVAMYTTEGQEALTWLVDHMYEPCSISAMGIAPDVNGDIVVWIGDKFSIRTYYNQSVTKDNGTLGSYGMAFSAVDQTMWSITPDGIGNGNAASTVAQLFDDGLDVEPWQTVLASNVSYTCSTGSPQPGSISVSAIAVGAYKDTSDSMLWAGCVAVCVDGGFASHSEYFVQAWVVTSMSAKALDPLTGHNDVIVELRHSGGGGSSSEENHTMWSASRDGQVIGWTAVDVGRDQAWVEMIRIETPAPLTSLSVRRLPTPPSPLVGVQSSALFMVWAGSLTGYISACMCNITDGTQWQPCEQIYVKDPIISLALAPGMGAYADNTNVDADDDDNDGYDKYDHIQKTATDLTLKPATYNIRTRVDNHIPDTTKETTPTTTRTVAYEQLFVGTPYVLVVGLKNGTVNLYCSESRLLASFYAAGRDIFSMLVTASSSVPNSPFYVWVGSKGGSFMHPGSVQGWECEFLNLTFNASRISYVRNQPMLCTLKLCWAMTKIVVVMVLLCLVCFLVDCFI